MKKLKYSKLNGKNEATEKIKARKWDCVCLYVFGATILNRIVPD